MAKMSFRHHYIRSPDRLLLHAVECGGGNSSCILIHGLGDNSAVWEEVTPPFAARYRTLVIDLRGHGESGWDPCGRYPIESYVRDINCLIEHLNVAPILLVGHSLGGNIAIRVAARWRHRITGMIIVDFGPDLNSASLKHLHRQLRSAHHVYSSVTEYEAWLSSRQPLVGTETLRRLAQSAVRRHADGTFLLKADPQTITAAENASGSDTRLSVLLASISCPVLVVRGLGSAVLPHQAALRMVEVLPNSRLQLVDGAGHAAMIDNPQGFIDGVVPFLRRQEATSMLQSKDSMSGAPICQSLL